MSYKKVPTQPVLGNMADYKMWCRLQPGEYLQVHQDDEPQNTIAINRSVDTIVIKPQYKFQGGYFFDIILTGKRPQRPHWTPVNMPEDVIEWYDTFNTKGCPEDLIFGEFNDQPIPSTYFDLTNNYDNNVNQINAALTDNEGVED